MIECENSVSIYLKYTEQQNDDSEGLKADSDPKTEAIRELCSFELRYSKSELTDLIKTKLGDNGDFDLTEFHEKMTKQVEEKISHLKNTYE